MSPAVPTKQVRIEPGGLWHRFGDEAETKTACGKPTPPLVSWIRAYKIDELICYDCFSRHEIETGRMHAIARDDATYPGIAPNKRPSEELRRRRRAARDTDVDDLESKDTLRDLPPSGLPAPDDADE